MAMNRASFAKTLEPGLNTLFGLEYDSYPAEYTAVFESNSSQKAYEEDLLLCGFGLAPTKTEGGAVSYDSGWSTVDCALPARNCRLGVLNH